MTEIRKLIVAYDTAFEKYIDAVRRSSAYRSIIAETTTLLQARQAIFDYVCKLENRDE